MQNLLRWPVLFFPKNTQRFLPVHHGFPIFSTSFKRTFSSSVIACTSSADEKAAQGNEPGLNRVLVRKLVSRADRIIHSGQEDLVSSYLKEKLGGLRGATQGYAFNELALLLLRRDRMGAAFFIASWMEEEGHQPSEELRSIMTALKLLISLPPDSAALSLKRAMTEKALDEASFCALLSLLSVKLLPPSLLVEYVTLYIASRPPGYQPSVKFICDSVEATVRAGLSHAADRWLELLKNEQLAEVELDSATYTTLVTALTRVDANDHEGYAMVMERMKEKNITADVPFFNALMNREAVLHRYDRVFSLYTTLYENRSPSMIPDTYTYCTLFHIIFEVARASLGGPRFRRHKRPSNMIDPRLAFKQMMECDTAKRFGRLSRRRRRVASRLVLNNALKAFMAAQDYPAAYIVLRTFRHLHLHPNGQTSDIIINWLCTHIRREFKFVWQDNRSLWVDRVFRITPRERSLISLQFGFEIHVALLLEQIDKKRSELIEGPVSAESDRSLPDTRKIQGKIPNASVRFPRVSRFDTRLRRFAAFLTQKERRLSAFERIILRVIYARLDSSPPAADSAVHTSLLEAKTQMIPPKPSKHVLVFDHRRRPWH